MGLWVGFDSFMRFANDLGFVGVEVMVGLNVFVTMRNCFFTVWFCC